MPLKIGGETIAALYLRKGGPVFNIQRAYYSNAQVFGPPGWLPSFAGIPATRFADFTTEGGTNRYFAAATQRTDAAAYLSAISAALTRASSAYRRNASGTLESVTSDVLRFDHSAALAPLGIRLEGARTNQQKQSHGGFTNATYWASFDVTPVDNNAAGPRGATTAATLTEASTTTTHELDGALSALNVVNGTTYCVWATVKMGSRRYAAVTFSLQNAAFTSNHFLTVDLQTGTITNTGSSIVSAGIVDYGAGYYLVWAVGTAGASVANRGAQVKLSNSGSTTFSPVYLGNGSTILLDATQFEAGAFPSSYIPTTSASVARAADSLVGTRTSPTSITKLIAGRTPLGAGTQVLWQADDGSEANRLRLVRNSSRELHMVATVSSSDVADINLGVVANDTDFRVAFRAAANDFAASLNGGTVGTDTAGGMPAGLVNERWGRDSAGNQWFGTIAKDAEWDGSLASDANLQALAA